MVGRVLLGQRAGAYGIWVSRPGVEVLSAGEDQLLLSGTRKMAQVVASGRFGASLNQSYGISWSPSLGFVPTIVVGSPRFIQCRVTSATGSSAVIHSGTVDIENYWALVPSPPGPTSPAEIAYTVLNIPV